ncbi:OLC1v1012148C1 [Oldenlandia corymbosa var. corymbosa]|uniref:histone deacetylase n=1 Tax=Oldenlandia corymbosa var. corymbosa TaxID=529605 RepID=A0AAV1DVB0_OLDCO|nr:OLC1v1012148C1 [Oldenlandia corymbosa var. corymbosa]
MDSSETGDVSNGGVAGGDAALLPPKRRRVGLLYDDRMCQHFDSSDHPENPNRIRSIWKKLQASGVNQRCEILSAKEAEDPHIALVHTKKHIDFIKSISSPKYDLQRRRLAASFNSIYFNEGSSDAACLAAGSVVQVAEKVAKGELDSAFAIVRPPGHHAEEREPMGFCLYNNVAIAASYLLNERTELGIKKILIVDWDVHHGNGTQKMFWDDPRVLFFSVHRHEFGAFYPGGDDGSYEMIGKGPGAGYNINVPWESHSCGDADYLAVWDHILIPVAKAFDPDLVIVSAGFDAAINDPLGGCCVSPYGYSVMLSKLMEFAQGRIVMALEGGYNLTSLANSALACVKVLLNDKPIAGSLEVVDPFESTWRVIQAVRERLSAFWPVLAEKLPEEITSKKRSPVPVASPESDGEFDDEAHLISEESESAIDRIVQPLQNLKVEDSHGQATSVAPSWRSELSKVDVWYATYGSNMRESRFLCYIEGGQDEGMQKRCSGSVDKTRPRGSMWKIFPHRLFFARDYTATWGPGGVAFLNPNRSNEDKAHMRLYKITLEQFNDVLLQETISNFTMKSPLFDWIDLQSIEEKKFIPAEAVKSGWYHNVLYLGKEDGVPILTMTCTLSDVESFKSGKFPVCPPSKAYFNTLFKGLTEGNQLSEEEAVAYLEQASSKEL